MDLVIALMSTVVFGLPLTFLLHEAGHALVGRLVGARLVWAQVGVGELRSAVRVLGVEWRLARKLTGARVFLAPRRVTGWRRRRIAIALGGPLVSAAVGLFAVGLALLADWPRPVTIAVGLFGAFNLIELSNLVPSRRRLTDGGNALAAWRWTGADELDSALGHRVSWLECAVRWNRLDEARGLAAAIVGESPGRFEADYATGLLELADGRSDAAGQSFRRARDLALAMGRTGPAEQLEKLRSELPGGDPAGADSTGE